MAKRTSTTFTSFLRSMTNKGFMTQATLAQVAQDVGGSPTRVSVYLSVARSRGAVIARKKVDGVTAYRLQKLPEGMAKRTRKVTAEVATTQEDQASA